MKINRKIYIPDQETFDMNQAGELTEQQKKHFCKSEDFTVEIHHTRESFVYYPGDEFYTFEKAHIDYWGGVNPLIGSDAQLLPDVEYELFSLKKHDNLDYFLSAKAVEPISEEAVYQAMVLALADCFDFTPEDLEYNKKNQLSPYQKKKYKLKKKEYDNDANLGVFEFVFLGEQTEESGDLQARYIQHIEMNIHDYENVFMFSVKYRIYYEPAKGSFLSIEPLEIVENVLPIQFSPHSPLNTDPSPPKPEPRKRTLPDKIFSGVYLLIFYLTAIMFILMGILMPFTLEGGGCIGIPLSIFGIWFLYRLIKPLPKEEDKSKQ